MKGSQSDLIWSNEVKQLGQIDIGWLIIDN